MRIKLLGPIPPPTDGRAVATSLLLDELRSGGHTVVVEDTHLDTPLAPLLKAFRCVRSAISIAVGRRLSIVLVASAGWGVVLEVLPALAARIRGMPLTVMHHSRAYVERRSWRMALLLYASGPSTRHVHLCPRMASSFGRTYGSLAGHCVVLDNAALVQAPPDDSGSRARTLTHLANLSHQKGTDVVVDLARDLYARGVGAFVTLAGPADGSIREVIEPLIRSEMGVQWVGAVGDEAKWALLGRSRVFLLPSRYRHEAQPLVIYEAASRGAIPIVWSVGWVRDQMQAMGLGRFVLDQGDFEGLAGLAQEVLQLDDAEFKDLSMSARDGFVRHRERSRSGLSLWNE